MPRIQDLAFTFALTKLKQGAVSFAAIAGGFQDGFETTTELQFDTHD
jgi:hypothetical protein